MNSELVAGLFLEIWQQVLPSPTDCPDFKTVCLEERMCLGVAVVDQRLLGRSYAQNAGRAEA
jgi:hypothetical protein